MIRVRRPTIRQIFILQPNITGSQCTRVCLNYVLLLGFIFIFLVFLEHEQIEPYIIEMTLQTEDFIGNRTFNCRICEKVGRTKQDMERHIESNHILTNPFECELCGKILKTRREIKRHHLKYHKI